VDVWLGAEGLTGSRGMGRINARGVKLESLHEQGTKLLVQLLDKGYRSKGRRPTGDRCASRGRLSARIEGGHALADGTPRAVRLTRRGGLCTRMPFKKAVRPMLFFFSSPRPLSPHAPRPYR